MVFLFGCFFGLRKIPVVLPEHLFEWLVEHDQPLPTSEECSEFWSHMAERDAPWVGPVIATGAQFIPVYLWGDDAQINERNEKVISVVCGFLTGKRANPKDSIYPLFTIRSEFGRRCKFFCFNGVSQNCFLIYLVYYRYASNKKLWLRNGSLQAFYLMQTPLMSPRNSL